MDDKSRSTRVRVDSVDQVRAIAILALIVSHFSPAIIERANPPEIVVNIAETIGRFATPAFVAIFGITCGIVYMRKVSTNFSAVRKSMSRRALLLLVCVLVTSVPEYLPLFLDGSRFKLFLLASYGILLFYAGAVLVMPWVMLAVERSPVLNSLLIGGGLWAVSYLLAFRLWENDPDVGYLELVRLYLVSGKYGFLGMIGAAVVMVPVGMAIARSSSSEASLSRTLVRVGAAGVLAILAGGWMGHEAGYSMLDLGSTPEGTPRVWFFTLMIGAMLVLLVILHTLRELRMLSYPVKWLTALGKASLPLYVGHTFIIPLSQLIRLAVPSLSDTVVLGMSGLVFLSLVVCLIYIKMTGKRFVSVMRIVFSFNAPRLRTAE